MAGIHVFRSLIDVSKTHYRDMLLKKSKLQLSSCFGVWNRGKYYSSSSEDYLHESIIPTMHFQNSLPRLPIPKLPDTCRRYLASQRPLLTDEQFALTKAIVDDFQRNEGPDLHTSLKIQDRQNKHTNYISGKQKLTTFFYFVVLVNFRVIDQYYQMQVNYRSVLIV